MPRAPALGHLLHTLDLATVLETHAVSRAAAAEHRDLRATREAFVRLGDAIESRAAPRWTSLELQFHRALNDQGGNLVLASLAERTLRDGLAACPILSPEELTILQSHHREILRCVEANAAEMAALRTRAHILYLRDVLISAAGSTPRTRTRLCT
jgi:DNA-binding GntR family transcriptional regulator